MLSRSKDEGNLGKSAKGWLHSRCYHVQRGSPVSLYVVLRLIFLCISIFSLLSYHIG